LEIKQSLDRRKKAQSKEIIKSETKVSIGTSPWKWVH